MIISLFFMVHAVFAEDAKCPADDKYKFQSIEHKLNLDGNLKPDVVAVFAAGAGEDACERRALIVDAPEKITSVKADEWITPGYFISPTMHFSTFTVEKRPVGDRDLLYVSEEFGEFASFAYFIVDAGKRKKVMTHAHSKADGQFDEKYDAKAQNLNVKIFDNGEFSVNGESIDLEQKALKNRCRVRELYLELKYSWDRKEHKFKEMDQGCVMGAAIDL